MSYRILGFLILAVIKYAYSDSIHCHHLVKGFESINFSPIPGNWVLGSSVDNMCFNATFSYNNTVSTFSGTNQLFNKLVEALGYGYNTNLTSFAQCADIKMSLPNGTANVQYCGCQTNSCNGIYEDPPKCEVVYQGLADFGYSDYYSVNNCTYGESCVTYYGKYKNNDIIYKNCLTQFAKDFSSLLPNSTNMGCSETTLQLGNSIGISVQPSCCQGNLCNRKSNDEISCYQETRGFKAFGVDDLKEEIVDCKGAPCVEFSGASSNKSVFVYRGCLDKKYSFLDKVSTKISIPGVKMNLNALSVNN
uniref:Uncharacterized protein n=1 Tax=Rhabditophanes sp. KR3021 TaxID=114890 RepID=A0AC35UBE0_9BILA